MPWAKDGGNGWDATRCSPLADDPNHPGESCTVVESQFSGIDDCELGAMCLFVDPKTNRGQCISMCQGSEATPICADACTECVIKSEGSFIPCMPMCDPLVQDCGEHRACYPYDDTFVCAVDLSDGFGQAGDPCIILEGCDPGSFCASADDLPGCEASSCCTPYCDTTAPETCDAIAPGTTCVPWFAEGRAPNTCGLTVAIGACIAPR